MFGHYFGYYDFDGERFWDIRDQVNYPVIDMPLD
jgi:hypothetical protein